MKDVTKSGRFAAEFGSQKFFDFFVKLRFRGHVRSSQNFIQIGDQD